MHSNPATPTKDVTNLNTTTGASQPGNRPCFGAESTVLPTLILAVLLVQGMPLCAGTPLTAEFSQSAPSVEAFDFIEVAKADPKLTGLKACSRALRAKMERLKNYYRQRLPGSDRSRRCSSEMGFREILASARVPALLSDQQP